MTDTDPVRAPDALVLHAGEPARDPVGYDARVDDRGVPSALTTRKRILTLE